MLGRTIADPELIESSTASAEGLALLPLVTRFGAEKRTAQVEARPGIASFLTRGSTANVTGYQIHMGRVERLEGGPVFAIELRNGAADSELDGAASSDGVVVGTMIHGLFENVALRSAMLTNLRGRCGIAAPSLARPAPVVDEYDRLAGVVRESIDLTLLRRVMRLEG
jgi:adenosylcobyric acid synthase